MIIDSKVIHHKTQRYETVGDWMFSPNNDRLTIRVSELGDPRYNFLVSIHEQIEAFLCLERGVDEKEITLFDMAYEADRPEGSTEEPGDDPKAPYRKEHFFATSIERLVASELGVDWRKYEEAINKL